MWVYPRVCGGADRRDTNALVSEGLSPRVRGSRALPQALTVRVGSIPACAGEPAVGRPSSTASTVYPRVCGGA